MPELLHSKDFTSLNDLITSCHYWNSLFKTQWAPRRSQDGCLNYYTLLLYVSWFPQIFVQVFPPNYGEVRFNKVCRLRVSWGIRVWPMAGRSTASMSVFNMKVKLWYIVTYACIYHPFMHCLQSTSKWLKSLFPFMYRVNHDEWRMVPGV